MKNANFNVVKNADELFEIVDEAGNVVDVKDNRKDANAACRALNKAAQEVVVDTPVVLEAANSEDDVVNRDADVPAALLEGVVVAEPTSIVAQVLAVQGESKPETPAAKESKPKEDKPVRITKAMLVRERIAIVKQSGGDMTDVVAYAMNQFSFKKGLAVAYVTT